MANKHLIPRKTTLFKNKLSKTLEAISRTRTATDLQTKEAYTLEAVKLVSSFYKQISESGFNPIDARSGVSPVLEEYNNNLESIKDDLDIVFAELENVEGVVIEHFNLVAAHSNRLSSRVKRLASRVNDFGLFSKLPLKNSIFFCDSFADLSKIESESPLLNSPECEINQVEGIVTLPINRGSTIRVEINENPVINSNSNGRAGNNEQINAAVNGTISTIFDNNADTWFEYERVIQVDDLVPLVLDFTVNLTDRQIINFIRINPNNFGAKTELEVVDISTSTDGEIYVSIKDDIPINGLLTEDEQNVFKLAPSTSKYAGEGLYTFTPRYAKYVRVILKQLSSYVVSTVRGDQFRYAIGIRDIEIQRQAYESTGEIVSTPFQTTDEIKKVALRTGQNPLQRSELASIRHQVSVDDGNTWTDISPIEDDGVVNTVSTKSEIVNINTEDSSSIVTEQPALSIRYKAILKRNDDGFNESSSSLATQKIETNELKAVPQFEPWSLTLDHPPLVGSVNVIDPAYGSRGKPDILFLLGQGKEGKSQYDIPFDDKLRTDLQKIAISGNSAKPYIVQENFIFDVYVGGEKWERSSDLESFGQLGNSTLNPEDKVYGITPAGSVISSRVTSRTDAYKKDEQRNAVTVNTVRAFEGSKNTDWVISFGDGLHGKAPAVGENIEVRFSPEKMFLTGKGEHRAELKFVTPNDKSLVRISRVGPVSPNSVLASKDSQIHRLEHRDIIKQSLSFSPGPQTLFASEVTFKNGSDEFSGTAGEYSVDYERGVIYTNDRSDPDAEITIQYRYQVTVDLSSTDWEWGDDEALHGSVIINDDAWVSNPQNGILVASGVRKVHFPHLSVVEGTLNVEKGDAVTTDNDSFLKEVPFLDGYTELFKENRREEDLGRIISIGGSEENVQIALKNPVSNSANRGIIFSNEEVFVTEKSSVGAVVDVGDYFVDKGTNTLHVRIPQTVEEGGTIIYWSEDLNDVPEGAYSVDYERGEVHLQRPITAISGGIGDYKLSYEYADYIIRYNIARKVEAENFVVDEGAKKVVILPAEIQRKARAPSQFGSGNFNPTLYQVNYNYIGVVREDIADLAPYFSPVLKDYALQIITKGFI